MNLKNYLESKFGQSSIEYMLLFAAMIVALIASGFIGNVRNAFQGVFNAARAGMGV